MTESTQQPDMSKSAHAVNTLLLAVNAALDKMGGMNIPEDPFERLAWLHDFAGALRSAPTERAEAMPEPVERLLRCAGKTMRTARNPNLTAREAIAVGDWIAALLAAADRVKELEADARRYRKWRADYTNPETNEVGHLSRMLLDLADAWTPEQVDAAIDRAQGEQHAG